LTDLYITTAWVGLDTAARQSQPLSGGLFKVRPGVRGRRANRFGG
jgi:sugar lactone lactonase YvrE